MEFGPLFRSMKHNKVRVGLIVFEIALTLAIVANCVTMILDARSKMVRASGFDDDNLLIVHSLPFDPAFKEDGYLDNNRNQDLDLMRSLPGVRAASNTRFMPWAGGGSSTELRAANTKGEMLRTQIYGVDEQILDTLGMSLVEGRCFTRDEVDRDTQRLRALGNSQRERDAQGRATEKFAQDIVITKAYASLAFGPAPSYLGKQLEDADGDLYQVIGVIDGFYNPYGWPIHEYAVLYATYSRSYQGGARYLVRSEPGRGTEVARTLEERLGAANAGRAVNVRTLTETKSRYFGPQRIVVTMMTVVVILLVFVTSLGLVGLTFFSVTERTRQIGTRRALGARQADILRHFLLENWLITSMGLVLGVLAAYGLNMGISNVVEGARMTWPLMAGGVVLLWATGVAATFAPALRAARISPAIATRNV
jgi:putative ABC transport system permease protein